MHILLNYIYNFDKWVNEGNLSAFTIWRKSLQTRSFKRILLQDGNVLNGAAGLLFY